MLRSKEIVKKGKKKGKNRMGLKKGCRRSPMKVFSKREKILLILKNGENER